MRASWHELDSDAGRLRQVDWLPTSPPRAAAMVVHGHGECGERHLTTVRPLLDRGIACSAVDLPGHGRSPGSRGAVPGFPQVQQILATASSAFEHRTGLPVTGWIGHSVGGLLAIHHLSSLQAPPPEFLWLNAPLVEPAAGRSWHARLLTRLFGGVFPCIPLHTGVQSSDCRIDSPHHDPVQDVLGELGHRRITLGWASALLRLGDSLPAAAAALEPSIRLLFTQGSDDPVCPAVIGRRLFDQLPQTSKRWVEIEGARHEPFADSHVTVLHQAVARWLDEEVLA